jgi:hypothetical protein
MSEGDKRDEERRDAVELTSGPGGTTGTGDTIPAGGGSGVGAAGSDHLRRDKPGSEGGGSAVDVDKRPPGGVSPVQAGNEEAEGHPS